MAAQNRFIEQCRSLFILAVQHIAQADEPAARELLQRIRAIEARWLVGQRPAYRVALGACAIGVGLVGGVLLRFGPMVMSDFESNRTADLGLLLFVVGATALHTLNSYFAPWVSEWIVDDCGDRLERLLNAGRRIALRSSNKKGQRLQDGLAPHEVFGLGPRFTLKQLNAARRRLATEYHPDRWQTAPASDACAAEEAMKRVNAAYDQIKGRTA